MQIPAWPFDECGFHITAAAVLTIESPGLVVMGGDSCSEGHGFKSQHNVY